MIPLKEAMFLWKPARYGNGETNCDVVRHPMRVERAELPYSTGACYSHWREMTDKERRFMMMVELWHIVARDGVPIEKAHNAFMKMQEYRDMLSYDFSIYKKDDE